MFYLNDAEVALLDRIVRKKQAAARGIRRVTKAEVLRQALWNYGEMY